MITCVKQPFKHWLSCFDLPPTVVPTTELELRAFWLQVPVADNQVSYAA
jgi:hypothetical protein